MWFRRKRKGMVDPVGWDEAAQRVHDVGFQPNGVLLHYSTCWCRTPRNIVITDHPYRDTSGKEKCDVCSFTAWLHRDTA